MSVIDTLIRHRIIITKLRRKPASFVEISDTLSREAELQERKLEISIRTFQRDMEDILSIYGIEILFDKKYRVYQIVSDHLKEVNERILEAFDLLNVLNHTERLNDIIHFEKRKPRGTTYLLQLKQAISQRKSVQFNYNKYWDKEPTFRTVEPYALKESQYRWYLLAKDNKDDCIKTFALDRISDLITLSKTFEYPPNYNVAETFRHCFGIIGPDKNDTLQEVVLSFTPFQGKYIKSLPLHESQTILEDSDFELRIKLNVYITYDFIKELISYGNKLKVIEPKSLVDKIKNNLEEALQLYNK